MKKSMYVLPVSTIGALAYAVPVFAAEGDVDVTGMLTTAFTSVQTTMMGTIAAIVPIALVVVGAVMAVRFGVKFFRGLAK